MVFFYQSSPLPDPPSSLPPSSLPDPPSSLPECEVFLSFSGLDLTSVAFASSLYTSLKGLGVSIFEDSKGQEKVTFTNSLYTALKGLVARIVGGGREEIDMKLVKAAITESKIAIPIFSKNYASCERCLGELTQMMECKRSMGQLILPIFYEVEPSDVKHQSGSYEDAFHKHAKRFDERAVKEWKEALREVGELKSWDLTREPNW